MTQAPEYRLVPVEPTEAQIEAGRASDGRLCRAVYIAMVEAAAHTAAPAADRAVSERIPFGWARTVCTPDTPMGAAEYDVDMHYGEDRPPGNGWAPLYTDPAPPADRAELAAKVRVLAENYAGDMVRENYKTAGDTFDKLRAAIDALARSTDAPSEPVLSALTELVKLKAQKRKALALDTSGDVSATVRRRELLFDYERRKPLAWEAAEAAIATPSAAAQSTGLRHPDGSINVAAIGCGTPPAAATSDERNGEAA